MAARIPCLGPKWFDGPSSDEESGSEEEDSEVDDHVDELDVEDDDDIVLKRMRFDSKFEYVAHPDQTEKHTSPDQTEWTNTISTGGRRAVRNLWKGRDVSALEKNRESGGSEKFAVSALNLKV
ncbi:unnamed protein product [Allacma fusca]|uniref:Uncharacterized protein n=1 Tax=Allacma fusca TaxID=39272 RepID=A0A8J2KJW5_9HEXA|nr:unnamed protein product [Allacma fusca]